MNAAAALTAAKPPTKPARRKNWYQTRRGEYYAALVSASKKWGRGERAGISFIKFCESRTIPPSVLRRFIGHEEATGVKKTTGQGRPYSAQKLLVSPSRHHVNGKVTTNQIIDVIEAWKREQMSRYKKDKRKRMDRFALFDVQRRAFIAKPSTPKKAALGMTNNVHCLVLNGRHYCYVLIRLKIDIEYYDSNRYEGRAGSNKRVPSEVMDVVAKAVGNQLHPDDSVNYTRRVATRLPKQENDVDCGAFVLFYADCKRNRMKIKPHLTTEEITNYRGAIWGYMQEAHSAGGVASNLPSRGSSKRERECALALLSIHNGKCR